jgi:hypothetical protein
MCYFSSQGEDELDEEDILDYLYDQHAKRVASQLPRGGALSAVRSVKTAATQQDQGCVGDRHDSVQKGDKGHEADQMAAGGGVRLPSCPLLLGRSQSNLGLLSNRLLTSSRRWWSRNASFDARLSAAPSSNILDDHATRKGSKKGKRLFVFVLVL